MVEEKIIRANPQVLIAMKLSAVGLGCGFIDMKPIDDELLFGKPDINLSGSWAFGAIGIDFPENHFTYGNQQYGLVFIEKVKSYFIGLASIIDIERESMRFRKCASLGEAMALARDPRTYHHVTSKLNRLHP